MRKLIVGAALLALLPAQANALSTDDLLALVAMPLAVAAVSDLTGVSPGELSNLVATLNNANVPPTQFVQVIRYVPVALVIENGEPDFVTFVRQQADQGVRGDALVTVIERQLRTIDPAIVFEPRPAAQMIVVDETFIPATVRARVVERREHPHGGPPGQLKKQLGVPTGAEVVHGERRGKGGKHGREHEREVRVIEPVPRAIPPMVSASPRGEKEDHGGHGRGHGSEKGKGKGKGKD